MRRTPSGWDFVPLREIVLPVESGACIAGRDGIRIDNEKAVLRVSAVTSGRLLSDHVKLPAPDEATKLKVFVKGDSVLVNRANGSADLVGVAVYAERTLASTYLSDKIWQIRPNAARCYGRFLALLLSSAWFRRPVIERSSGGTGMRNISSSSYLSIQVPLPPLPVQRKIATILGAWDRTIETLQALVTAKTKRLRSLRQQLLTGTRRLPKYRGNKWRRVQLSDVLRRVFRQVDWAPDRVFRLVSIRRRCGGLFRREDLRGADYKTTDLHEIRTGDFLVSKRQVVHGAWGMVTKEFSGCHVSKEYAILVNTAPAVLHMPFFDWLCHERRMWHLAFLASDGVHLEKLIFEADDFLRHHIQLPPSVKEQQHSVNVLDACDHEIHLLETKLDAFKQQKRGLMQKLLTGEVRVKV